MTPDVGHDMIKTISAIYDKIADAHNAILSISETPHFSMKDINIISQDKDSRYSQYIQTLQGEDAAKRDEAAPAAPADEAHSASSRIVGALANMLIGARALVMPSIGPVLAIGPVSAILAGAGPEAMVASLPTVIGSLGVNRNDAELYAEAIRRGATLVLLRAEGANADTASDILKSHHPVDMASRAEQWRSKGWVQSTAQSAVHAQELAEHDGLASAPLLNGATDHKNGATDHKNGATDHKNGATDQKSGSKAQKAAARKNGDAKRTHDSSDMKTRDADADVTMDDDFREHLRINPPTRDGVPNYEDHRDAYAFGVWLGRLDRFEKMKWEQTQTEAHKLWAEQHNERGETWEEIKDRVQYAWHKVKASTYQASL